jgi:S1-C subfamily serine protease
VTVAKLPQMAPVDPNDVGAKRLLVELEAARVEIKEKESNPLNFITFFELRRVGLEVKAADGAVRVSAVAAGKACEKAGVKAGDTILEVNGKKPADAEALRRLLRDALAVGDAAVKLQRGNDTLTVKLALPE